MDCLDYAKRNNLVTMGMEKWIETEQYRSILELMKRQIHFLLTLFLLKKQRLTFLTTKQN